MNKKNNTEIILCKRVPRDLIFEIHRFVLNLRKEKKLGQRGLAREVKKQFNIGISENTISGWIHRYVIPFENEKTQFKPKPIPPKTQLYELYINQELSASKIAQKFKVATITVINWLKQHEFTVRSHTESMNTSKIKKELREKQLTIPTKDYSKLSPEKAYLLGVLAGDGFINKKIATLEIRKDIEFVEEFSRCLESVYGVKYNFRYYAPRNSYILHATSEIICKDLLKYGEFATYSWEVPDAILTSNDKKMIGRYLRGLYDSEGSATKYIVTFPSISEKGAKTTQFLLTKLGIRSKLSRFREKYYRIAITSKENLEKFKNLIGFTIKRKMEKLP